jgi:hypothetical protein
MPPPLPLIGSCYLGCLSFIVLGAVALVAWLFCCSITGVGKMSPIFLSNYLTAAPGMGSATSAAGIYNGHAEVAV